MKIWKTFKILSYLITTGLIIYVVRDCTSDNDIPREIVVIKEDATDNIRVKRDTVYITKTVTKDKYIPQYTQVIDSIYVTKDKYIPQYIQVIDSIYVPNKYIPQYTQVIDSIYVPIDNMMIVKDFLSKRSYNDTVSIDVDDKKIAIVTIEDTVTMNQIINRRINWTVDMPTSIVKTKNNSVSRFYYGTDIGFGNGTISSTSFNAMYVRNANAYKLGVGVNNSGTDLSFFINAGIYFTISK